MGLDGVIKSMTPAKALQRVKRYLRRECRKPNEMKMRVYTQHIKRINTDDIPRLPPFDPDQGLSDDEILDIVLYGTPRTWTREMDRQGSEPFLRGLEETIKFMENLETAEEFEPRE